MPTLFMGYRPTERRIRSEIIRIVKEGKVKSMLVKRDDNNQLGDSITWGYEK